jgi:dipeptidyl aminopeptidase/acylaminoacyl peptidase
MHRKATSVSKFTPESLVYGLKTVTDPQISPNGEWIAYAVAEVLKETNKRTSQIWLTKRDGSETRQLTFAGKSSSKPRWSPDGQSIAFVSDRGDGNTLYLLPLTGGEARPLVPHRSGITHLEWSPDGTKIALAAVVDPENPEGKPLDKDKPAPIKVTTRPDYKQDTRGYLGDKRAQIFVYDLESGDERQLTEGPSEYFDPRWSPDGTKIAALAPIESFVFAQLAVIDVASGELRRLLPGTGAVGPYTWTPDGAHILIATDEKWDFQEEFHLLNVATGQADQLTRDLQPNPGAAAPVWIDDRRALFPAMHKGRNGVFAIDIETGEVAPELIGESMDDGFSTDAAGRYIARATNDFGTVGELQVHDRESGKTSVLTSLNGDFLAEYPPAQWDKFVINRNGYDLETWVLKPAGFDPAKKYPLILSIHGGPNGAYGYAFNALMQLWASNDFVIAFSNPRGSSSYGGDFTRQVANDWGGEDFLDLMAVTDEAVKLPYVDPERTGVYGYSYGGYMTTWVIGHTDRFKAAGIGAPAADMIAMFGTSDISSAWLPFHFGGTPWENPKLYLERSPITHLHNAKTPALIIQAEGDIRCPVGQAEQVFATLKKIGVETELARYPGGDHGFLRTGEPAYAVDAYTRLLAWFKKHLGEPV